MEYINIVIIYVTQFLAQSFVKWSLGKSLKVTHNVTWDLCLKSLGFFGKTKGDRKGNQNCRMYSLTPTSCYRIRSLCHIHNNNYNYSHATVLATPATMLHNDNV